MRRQSVARLTVLVAVALLFSVAVTPHAQQNDQRLYPLRSPEVQALRSLTIEAGIALPFSSGPFPAAELRAALARIDDVRLSDAGRVTRAWLIDRLDPRVDYEEEGGRFAFRVDPEFTLESYLHSDGDNPLWEYDWPERRPIARFPFEWWVLNNAYGLFDLGFRKNIPDFSVYPTYSESSRFTFDEDGRFGFETSEEDPFTNVPYNVNTLDVQFPQRAFISIGGDRWNALIGREPLDWGNGHTGNLYISDNGAWHDSLQFSTFWQRFKFSWAWVNLDGKLIDEEREFVDSGGGWDTDGDGEIDAYGDDPGGGAVFIAVYRPDLERKSLIAQRFELRLWERLGLAYTEGIILGRTDPELRYLNPLFHYHSLYTNTQNVGNVHRSFEFDVAIARGVSFYAILAADQWSSPLEPNTDVTEEPNAVAYLAGIDLRRPLAEGYLAATFEGVYATPWMYIHNHPLTSITQRRLIMAQHGKDRTQVWVDTPLGHYGGNDFALVWLDVSHRVAGRYRYGLNTYWEGDGSVPMYALLESVEDDRRGPIDEDDAEASAPSGGYDGRRTQWRAAVSLYGEVFPWFLSGWNAPGASRTLRISSEVSAQWTRNRLHLSTPWEFDLQWVVSTTVGL